MILKNRSKNDNNKVHRKLQLEEIAIQMNVMVAAGGVIIAVSICRTQFFAFLPLKLRRYSLCDEMFEILQSIFLILKTKFYPIAYYSN